MSKRFPARPAHPERICWGCDRYCPADAMVCGNASVATLDEPAWHELFKRCDSAGVTVEAFCQREGLSRSSLNR